MTSTRGGGRTATGGDREDRRDEAGPGTRAEGPAAHVPARPGHGVAARRRTAVAAVHVHAGQQRVQRHVERHGVGQPGVDRPHHRLERLDRLPPARPDRRAVRRGPVPRRLRHRLEALAQAGARPVRRLGDRRVVVRRGSGRDPARRRHPLRWRPGRGPLLRTAGRAALAGRGTGPALRGRPYDRGPGGQGRLGRHLGPVDGPLPGRLRSPAAGAARPGGRPGQRAAGLAGPSRPLDRGVLPPPRHVGGHRSRRDLRGRGRRRLPAVPGHPVHPGAGHGGVRRHLGGRPELRRHPGRGRHRPEQRPAGDPAGDDLLAAHHPGRSDGRVGAGTAIRPEEVSAS